MSQIGGKAKHGIINYSITDNGELLEQIELPMPYIHGG